jgi:hypothetical protein
MRRLWLLMATLCAAATVTAALAGQPYVVSEQMGGNLWRVQDLNDDGDALDVGERTLWADGFTLAFGLETFGGAVFAADGEIPLGPPDDKIVRLMDLNGDGDALDVGERVVWAAGLNQPAELVADGAGGFYVSEFLGDDVLRLVDANGDGDALDVGERTTYADAVDGAAFLLPMGDRVLVSSVGTDQVFSLTDVNGDGDALDVAEKLSVLTNAGGSIGALEDGNGGFFFGAVSTSTVYHAQDKNGDGDFLDVGEVLSYADSVYGDLFTPWTMADYAGGGFLLADRDAGVVRWVRDVNGDGDALDLGEVTVFADGITGGPFDIVAMPTVPDADFDGDGDVDGVDFLTWQRGYGLMGQTDNANGDANFDSVVNGGDLDVWETQYGMPPPLAAAAVVPEPDSSALCLLAFVLIFSHRDHRVEYEVFPFSLRSL